MRPKSMILIVIALGCGLVASIGISQVMENRAANARGAVITEKIFVATADVDLGQPLTAEMVKLEEWPKDKIPNGAIRTLEEVEGRRPLTRLYPGEPILTAKLIDPNKLVGPADRIPAGYRVVSVKVTMESAASGLINPGDRVDVVVFLRRSSDVVLTSTRTILRDVTVFAVNQQIDRQVDEDGTAYNARTVSLLVKPDQVEKLTLASELGSLRLSLRRADDDTQEITGGASVDDLLTDRPDADGSPSSVPFPAQFVQTPQAEPSDGIIGFLKGMATSMSPSADIEVSPAEEATSPKMMAILTPDGIQSYHWDNPRGLPRELAASPVASSGLTSQAGGWSLSGPATPVGPDESNRLQPSTSTPSDTTGPVAEVEGADTTESTPPDVSSLITQ